MKNRWLDTVTLYVSIKNNWFNWYTMYQDTSLATSYILYILYVKLVTLLHSDRRLAYYGIMYRQHSHNSWKWFQNSMPRIIMEVCVWSWKKMLWPWKMIRFTSHLQCSLKACSSIAQRLFIINMWLCRRKHSHTFYESLWNLWSYIEHHTLVVKVFTFSVSIQCWR